MDNKAQWLPGELERFKKGLKQLNVTSCENQVGAWETIASAIRIRNVTKVYKHAPYTLAMLIFLD